MDPAVMLTVEDNVALVMLNRPETLNALSDLVKEELMRAMDFVRTDDSVKSVVLAGTGRSFCAGGDISGMGKRTAVESHQRLGEINDIVTAMAETEKTVIAAVQGPVAGAGVSLALAADVIFASDEARFIFSFSKLGLMADAGGMYFLPRAVGVHKAKTLLFSGGILTAQDGLNYGFVHEVCPRESLHAQALAYAQELAHGPTRAYAAIKGIVNRSLEYDLRTVLQLERSQQTVLQQTQDHKEGVDAFRDKRPPKFQGE